MRFRNVLLVILCAGLSLAALPAAGSAAAQQGAQSGATAAQRLDVDGDHLRARLDELLGVEAGVGNH